MARKGNPISVRLNLNRSSDPNRFSDYYYGDFVYQYVNLRDYSVSIRPPTRGCPFGFRLGRFILHHSPKRTFIHLSISRRPRRLKRRGKSRLYPGRRWAFGKVRLIGPDDGEERNEVRGARSASFYTYSRAKLANMTFVFGRGAGETVKSTGLPAGEERGEVRIWPIQKKRYGFYRWSNISQLLRVSGWMDHKHPMSGKYAAKKSFVNVSASNVPRGNQYCSCPFFFLSFLYTTLRYATILSHNHIGGYSAGSKAKQKPQKPKPPQPHLINPTPAAIGNFEISEATIINKIYRHSRTRASPGKTCSLVRGLLVAYWGHRLNCQRKRKALGRFHLLVCLGNKSFPIGKTKLFKRCLLPFRPGGPTSQILRHTIPAGCPSSNFLVMQYYFQMDQKSHSDPGELGDSFPAKAVVVPNHFVAAAPAEPGKADRQGVFFKKRIRSRIALGLCDASEQSSRSEFLAEARFICRAAIKTKTSIPFFGATFLFRRPLRSNNQIGDALPLRKQLLGQLRIYVRDLLGKEKVIRLVDFIDRSGIGGFFRGIGMMISIILRNRRIPYGYNYYLNEVRKVRSLLSDRTNTNTFFGSVKIESVHQSASPIAQDISFQLRGRNRTRSFRSIFSQIVRDIPNPKVMPPKGVRGIRICRPGRLKGAEIARTECREYGKTSINAFCQKIDHASAKVSTRYGISGVKVWISYSSVKGRVISKTYEIS
uniref:Ribosomal protein S3 n=1 Tax=Gnetum gnemon TaxID=3382 RepID=A0A6M3X312_GNEGN|nr:ribosomal protein S3 [Gnetum gnemon]